MDIAINAPDRQFALWEANHRFLNTLTALGGLLRRDFSAFADPAVREAVSLHAGRLETFAGLLRTLGEQPADALVDVADHLGRVCEELCAVHLAPHGVRCEFSADAGVLPREACRTLSLIVTELVTNAARHGFAGRLSGRVSVSLRRAGAGWICHVADNGGGFRGASAGDGMRLVDEMVRGLGGDLRVHSDGGGVIVSFGWVEEAVTLDSDGIAWPCWA